MAIGKISSSGVIIGGMIGQKGAMGKTGPIGKTPHLTIGNVKTVEKIEQANVIITGTDENPVLNILLPRGEKGETGKTGLTPKIEIGTVSTLNPDENAIVNKSGTKEELILDIGIPRGKKGDNYVLQESDKQEIINNITSDANSEFNLNVKTKTEEFNVNVGTKINEFNDNATTKNNTFNTNANSKQEEYDTNAQSQQENYDTNALKKLEEYNENAKKSKESFDTNVITKTTEFNDNVTQKTSEFNQNVNSKTDEFNSNANVKTEEFNSNAEQKTNEFNENVSTLQEQFSKVVEENERLNETISNLPKIKEKTGTDLTLDNTSVGYFYHENKKGMRLSGNINQEITRGEQLYNYKDFSSVSSGITTDEEGWITVNYDNSEGTNAKYLNYYTHNLDLKLSTNYNIIVEIKDVKGTGKAVFTSSHYTSNDGQFSNDFFKSLSSLSANSIIQAIRTTKSQLYGDVGMRTFVEFLAGQSGSITFRISVLKDTTITPEKFIYEKFTDGQPSPNLNYPSELKVVRGWNEFNAYAISNKNIVIENDGKTIKLPMDTSTQGYNNTNTTLSTLCPNLKVGDEVFLHFTRNLGNSYNNCVYLHGANMLWINGTLKKITKEMLEGNLVIYGNNFIAGETKQCILSDFVIVKGKYPNLISLIDGTYTHNGVTAIIKNGTITLNGTPSSTSFIQIPININITNEKYIFALNNNDIITDTYSEVRLQNSDGIYKSVNYSNKSNSYVFDKFENTLVMMNICTSIGTVFENFVITPTLKKVTIPNKYMPFNTIGIKVMNENIFDIKKAVIASWDSKAKPNSIEIVNDSIISKSNFYEWRAPCIDIMNYMSNTDYVIKVNCTSDSNIIDIRVYGYNGTKPVEISNYIGVPEDVKINFNSENYQKIGVSFNASNSDMSKIYISTFTNIQVKRDTNANPYVAHQEQNYLLSLGDLWLGKIREYEDYFHNKNNEWYLHKKIRHLPLKISDMNNSEAYPGWKRLDDIKNDFPNKNELLTNFSTFVSNISNDYKLIGINTADSANAGILFLSKIVINLTQTEWKEKYPDLVLDLYYGLQNGYDIKITDTTLIKQLNDLENALSYKGQTNISQNADVPFRISSSALYDLNNLIDRVAVLETS